MPNYLAPGVYVEEVESGSRPIEGVGTAVAAFVGFAAQGPFNTPTLVTNWSQYSQIFGEFAPDCYLGHAVYGYFMQGGGAAYIVRVGGDRAEEALPAASAPAAVLGTYKVVARALPEGTPEDVSVEVADPPEGAGEDRFNLVVKRGGQVVETFESVTTKRGKDNVVNVVRERSKLITIEEAAPAGQLARPSGGEVALIGPGPTSAPENVSADEYVGDAAERTGFGGLEAVDEVTMVAVPDLMGAYQRGAIDLDSVKTVQSAMIAHCELMGDRMAILDPPPALSPQQVREWRTDQAGYDSKYAALYYPWIKVFDPLTGTNRFMPPSGHLAGVWARNDGSRGVHKAPANEVIRGAVALETQLTRTEQELLNPLGVNCIRAFPGRGILVWGARTLSSDPAWRYLNVRRLFNYLEESILNGTQWVVFEPNDDMLWARIRRTVSAFLVNEWRRGALFGLTPDEAFFVKCDRETNPAESIDAGQVICQIGVAPVKPAEFVIFQLAQMSGGTSLVNE
ncbi:phage tail sheath family protein [Micromonospora endophytica]|uniref:Phage tail protein n=1 Tax=Micromonospora endophytica TaxID=515350 RepID=A0A2W2E0V3_9ACTN|nr:phage tail sheath subtilisin-like domain-containing protein [Micromonospora endophytica]PZF98603.1 phage tail protein [Micromonospora endophytica]RIW40752.1 phage tail sheath family protein [Micromonospora endophytica]BCJ56890.1 tail protein [Micromonospora endophytica]